MNPSEILKREDLLPVVRSVVSEELDLRLRGNHPSSEMEKIKALEESLSAKDSEISELQEALAVNKSKIKDLKKSLKSKDLKVDGLETALNVARSNVKDLKEALEVEKSKVKELEVASKDKDAKLAAAEGELEKMKGQLGVTKRKLEEMQNYEKEENTVLDQLIKKRKAKRDSLEASTLVSAQEASVRTYLESMFKELKTDKRDQPHEFEAKRDKLAAEKTLHEKLSAEVILKCETTKNLAEEQKDAVKSMLFILYKNCKGPSDTSVLSSFPALVDTIMNSCRIPKPALIQVPVPKVTPLSLGFSIDYAKFHCVIPKNTKIPAKATITIRLQMGMETQSTSSSPVAASKSHTVTVSKTNIQSGTPVPRIRTTSPSHASTPGSVTLTKFQSLRALTPSSSAVSAPQPITFRQLAQIFLTAHSQIVRPVFPVRPVLAPSKPNVVPVAVYQGESGMVADNTWLDEFSLGKISSSNAAEELSITMEIDSQGVLQVTPVFKINNIIYHVGSIIKNFKIPAYKWILMDGCLSILDEVWNGIPTAEIVYESV